MCLTVEKQRKTERQLKLGQGEERKEQGLDSAHKYEPPSFPWEEGGQKLTPLRLCVGLRVILSHVFTRLPWIYKCTFYKYLRVSHSGCPGCEARMAQKNAGPER